MKSNERFLVPVDQLRWRLDPADLGFETTEEVEAMLSTPGQHRAVRALEIGLGLRSPGYNVFVAGEPGTRRVETLERLLESHKADTFEPEDFCYVHNFRDPDQPALLRFPAGQGSAFREGMTNAVRELRRGIPGLLSSDIYTKRKKARIKRFTNRLDALASPLREKARAQGLALVQVEAGGHSEAELLPMIDDEPMAYEDLDARVESGAIQRTEMSRLIEARERLLVDLKAFSEAADRLAMEAGAEFEELNREMTRPYLNAVLRHVYRDHQDIKGVVEFLKGVEELINVHLDVFARSNEGVTEEDHEEVYSKLRVNLILDSADIKHRPVVPEPNPTLRNMRGVIDRDVRAGGRVVSDYMHIRAGSILRAHQGFLVLHADDLEGEGVITWALIKRTLRTGQLRIEQEGDGSPKVLRPEPIDVDVKVIVVGTPDLYQALLDADPDFQKLFKIKAEFDSEMELTSRALKEHAALIRAVSEKESLPPLSAAAVARVIEFGVRLAGRRNRITTRYSQVEDLVQEAAFWARARGASRVEWDDVEQALEERRNRVNLIEERSQRMIREGVLLIDTEGKRVGQVNGLTVINLGDHQFGRPVRITASVGAGATGIINIERQAALSGSHHDKGLQILAGFLQETFAQRHPLGITAAITLEQSYSEVDGDSATVAEVLTLLSALSDVPLRQGLAVTASMNQKGDIQPVGGLNEKIEGFFDLCRAREFTGEQGVVMPAANLPNLMLRPDVVDAVAEGTFRIYAVSRIEEAVEVLTGKRAGWNASRRFGKTTVFGMAQAAVQRLSKASRDFMPWS